MDVTEFVLWKKDEDTYSGFGKYFGLSEYPCLIKRKNNSYEVIMKINNKWIKVGSFYKYKRPIRIRAEKEYWWLGEIRIGDDVFHVLDLGNRLRGI